MGALAFSVFVWALLAALVAVFLYQAVITLRSLMQRRAGP